MAVAVRPVVPEGGRRRAGHLHARHALVEKCVVLGTFMQGTPSLRNASYPLCAGSCERIRSSKPSCRRKLAHTSGPKSMPVPRPLLKHEVPSRWEDPMEPFVSSHRKPSEAIRGHQRPSVAIRGHQRPSVAISGHQRSSSHLNIDRIVPERRVDRPHELLLLDDGFHLLTHRRMNEHLFWARLVS